MKVVINACHGAFGLSPEAIMKYAELTGRKLYPAYRDKTTEEYVKCNTLEEALKKETDMYRLAWYDESGKLHYEINPPRHDPCLVQVVEMLGERSNGTYACLRIIEILDDVENYIIQEYDGKEWIAEPQRAWGQ